MARPPSPYPANCGSQWQQRELVRGTLPGTKGFGHDFSQLLDPLVSDLLGGAGRLGWGGSYERDRMADLRAQIEGVLETLRLDEPILGPKKVRSIEYLLQGAAAQLDAVGVLHNRWNLRPEGTFGLQYGDTLRDFPSARYWQDCVNPDNILTPPGPHYGFEVQGWGRGANVVCPGRAELQQRPKDRAAIVTFFRDAARWIRCAQKLLWRNVLYAQALEAWNAARPPERTPPGTPQPVPTGGGGDLTGPIPVPPTPGPRPSRTTPLPPDPSDAILPDPPLVPPSLPDLPDHVGPFTVTATPKTTRATTRGPVETLVSGVVVVGALYGGWLFFNKVL